MVAVVDIVGVDVPVVYDGVAPVVADTKADEVNVVAVVAAAIAAVES